MAGPSSAEEDHGRLLTLAVLALVVGAAAGLIGTVFRLVLERADTLRDRLIAWAHGEAVLGFALVVVGGAAAALVAAWLVRRFCAARLRQRHPARRGGAAQEAAAGAATCLIPVKFVGGLLAIGSGLALGREGPSVQMGASIAHLVGTMFRRSWPDCRVLLAAGAGAGLATAFNAPIAGAVFVLEELVRRFEHRIAIAALGASATADRGRAAHSLATLPTSTSQPLARCRRRRASRCSSCWAPSPACWRSSTTARCSAPSMLADAARTAGRWRLRAGADRRGGGRARLVRARRWSAAATRSPSARSPGAQSLAVLPLLFLLRLVLGAGVLRAGTPGGLFAPMLVLGAQLGLLFGAVCGRAVPRARHAAARPSPSSAWRRSSPAWCARR